MLKHSAISYCDQQVFRFFEIIMIFPQEINLFNVIGVHIYNKDVVKHWTLFEHLSFFNSISHFQSG